VYGYPSSGGRIDFAATCKCRYLELLRYPNLPFPRQSEGELDDTSLLEWFNKVLRAVIYRSCVLHMLTSLRISPCPVLQRGVIKHLLVVCGYCKCMLWKYRLSSSPYTLRIGVCNFSPEELCPTLSFRRESFRAIEEHLGLPEEFLKSIKGNTTQAFKFSKQNRGNKPLTCKSLFKDNGNS
jgi:hypothetical protein